MASSWPRKADGAVDGVILAGKGKRTDLIASSWPRKADGGFRGVILARKGKSLDSVVSSWRESSEHARTSLNDATMLIWAKNQEAE